ncbi:hypothetical protein HO965_01250 [Streptococcus suis]|nr:hypothetical protein [Streptococcus suis]WNF85419.1 hypothetical protein RJW52_05755 [Streptococcus suis]
MKKYLTLGLALASLFLLSGCQSKIVQQLTGGNTSSSTSNSSTVETSSSTTSSTSLESSSSTSSETSTSSTTSSSQQETVTSSAEKDYESLYAETLTKVAEDPEGTVTHYAFYDIDGNGTKELFTGVQDSTGAMYGAAVYYLNQSVSTYLAHSEVAPVGGYRASFTINSDRTVTQYEWTSFRGEGIKKTYQLAADDSAAILLEEKEIIMGSAEQQAEADPNPLDLSILNWQVLEGR